MLFFRLFRCILMEMPSVKKRDISVYLVDFGAEEIVSVETLRIIKEDHCLLPGAGIAVTIRMMILLHYQFQISLHSNLNLQFREKEKNSFLVRISRNREVRGI